MDEGMADDPRIVSPTMQQLKDQWNVEHAAWEKRMARNKRIANWLMLPSVIGALLFAWAVSRTDDVFTAFLMAVSFLLIFPFHWMSSYITRPYKERKNV